MHHIALLLVLLFATVFPASGAGLPGSEDEAGNAVRQERPRTLASGKDSGCQELSAADGTRLGLIRQMLDAGKPYAAIAHLDAAAIAAPQAELLRADGLRQTGRDEQATQLYQKLLKGCVAGYAYQGLGLIASRAGKARDAFAHLRAAAAALPVDSSIRGDYGYALMATGDNQAAMHEFLTALELAPDNRRAANNLIVLLLRGGEPAKAEEFASRFAVSAGELEKLKKIAQMPLTGVITDDGQTPGLTSTSQ